jgi:N-acyl-D-aspartate/D-glutamate deacylase
MSTGLTGRVAIRGGTIYDGTGAEGRLGDVLLEGGRIAEVGYFEAEANEVDATGLAVAPGFVDIHSHSDYTLLMDPRAVSAIHQGVTTEVVGNCGFGCFPIRDVRTAQRAIYGYSDELPITWSSAGDYFERLEQAHPAVNVASLVPNGQLRLATLGLADRPADPRELATMQTLLREALAEGAWGYSTGLEYPQEQAATEDEVVALAGLAPFYATHTRHRDAGAADAVAEALRTGRRARVRLQVSHLVPRNGVEETLRCVELVETAHDAGDDVAFDMHTRTFGLTNLHAALPAWALASDDLAALLRDPANREAMQGHRSILSAGGDWSRVVLLDNDIWKEYARRDIASIAAERGQKPTDAIYDLLLGGVDELHRLLVIIRAYTEEQQCDAFVHPLCVPGSDATTLAPDGPLGGASFHGAYTWAAWFWRFMVRERAALTPEEAVHRLTGAPAERIGLPDRGVLRPGARADVAIFDPESFRDHGTTFDPNRIASGMHHVFVNGVWTLKDGRLTGSRAGEVLRRRTANHGVPR